MAYDKDTDYQAIINEAVSKGDYQTAALAEQSRNEKIKSEGITDYSTTNKYSSYLSPSTSSSNTSSSNKAYSPTATAPTNFTGSSTAVNTYTNSQQAIKDQMNANSQAWWSASDEEKAALEAENKRLAAQLGSGVTFDPSTGTWSGSADQPLSQTPSFTYGTARPTYTSNYQTSIDDMLNQILTREDFKYDVTTDPLYQQYAQQYNREGNRAMNDTLASVASQAGGMNSYAVTAAQQANDYYSSQLNDKIPELYQLAYSMYLDDIDNQVRDLGLLQSMDDTQYNRYRDTMSDWANDRNFAYGVYRDDVGDYQWDKTFDYNASRDQIADSRYDQEWEYNVGRDAIEDSRYDQEWEYNTSQSDHNTAYNQAMDFLSAGIMPNSDLLASAGISNSEASAYIAAAKSAGSRGSSSGGSGGSSGSSGSLTFSNASQLYSKGVTTPAALSAYVKYGFMTEEEANSYLNGGSSSGTSNSSSGSNNSGEVELNWNSVNSLGIGPVSATRLAEIAEYGGIIEHADGSVTWASGWNANNYQQKLSDAKKNSLNPFAGITLR